MAEPVNLAEAKARLADVVRRAAGGEEIVIARNGVPQARLVPLRPATRRVPGTGSGRWEIADDFNDPLPPEVLRTFEGPDE